MSYKADKKYEANKIEIFPGGRSLNQKTFHKDGMDIFWNMMRCTCTTLYDANQNTGKAVVYLMILYPIFPTFAVRMSHGLC